MSDTITGDVSGAIAFEMICGYRANAEDRSVLHPILGTSTTDIVDRHAGLRRGNLDLLIVDESEAGAAFNAFCTPQTFTLASSSRPWIDMSFKRAGGDPEIELDPDTRDAWVVRVPFLEVAS